jgi:hypothetical protein
LGKALTAIYLTKLVYEGRNGSMSALDKFAGTMFYTLHEQAFDVYQRFHGPVGFCFISHSPSTALQTANRFTKQPTGQADDPHAPFAAENGFHE